MSYVVACYCSTVYEVIYGPPVCPTCGHPVEIDQNDPRLIEMEDDDE